MLQMLHSQGGADRQWAMFRQAVFSGRVLTPAPFDIILALMLRSTLEDEMMRRKRTAWRQSTLGFQWQEK